MQHISFTCSCFPYKTIHFWKCFVVLSLPILSRFFFLYSPSKMFAVTCWYRKIIASLRKNKLVNDARMFRSHECRIWQEALWCALPDFISVFLADCTFCFQKFSREAVDTTINMGGGSSVGLCAVFHTLGKRNNSAITLCWTCSNWVWEQPGWGADKWGRRQKHNVPFFIGERYNL